MDLGKGYRLPEFVPILGNGIRFKYFILVPSLTRLPPDLLQLWHGTLENCSLAQTVCLASSCITVPFYFCVMIIYIIVWPTAFTASAMFLSQITLYCWRSGAFAVCIYFCTILIFRFLLMLVNWYVLLNTLGHTEFWKFLRVVDSSEGGNFWATLRFIFQGGWFEH